MTKMTKKNQYSVGLFVFLGIITVLVSIFFIGSNKSMFVNKLELQTEFEHVQGLSEGSVVSLAGIRIGNVKSVEFNSSTKKVLVKMQAEEDLVKELPSDSTVEIRTQGALGDKFIFINPGNQEAGFVKNKSFLKVAQSNDIMSILSERGGEATKAFDIINNVEQATKALSVDDRTNRIMKNLLVASESVKMTSLHLEQMSNKWAQVEPQKIQNIIKHFENIAAKVDRGQGTLGALVNDSTLHDRIKTLFGDSPRRDHTKSIIQSTLGQAAGEK